MTGSVISLAIANVTEWRFKVNGACGIDIFEEARTITRLSDAKESYFTRVGVNVGSNTIRFGRFIARRAWSIASNDEQLAVFGALQMPVDGSIVADASGIFDVEVEPLRNGSFAQLFVRRRERGTSPCSDIVGSEGRLYVVQIGIGHVERRGSQS